jgi:hypothetical protein
MYGASKRGTPSTMAYLRGLNHKLFKILTTKASVSPLRNLYQNFPMPRSAFALIPGPSENALSHNIRLRAEVGWGEEVLTRRGFCDLFIEVQRRACAHFFSKLLLGPVVVRWLSPDRAAIVSDSEQNGRWAMGTARAIAPCKSRRVPRGPARARCRPTTAPR